MPRPIRRRLALAAAVAVALVARGPAASAQTRLHTDVFVAGAVANWQFDRYGMGGGVSFGVEWAPTPALGLTLSGGWAGLAASYPRQASGGIPRLATGGYASIDAGLRLRPLPRVASGAERLYLELAGGLARTGDVFAPVVRARAGWSFAAGPLDAGPWVGWAWLPQTDALAYPGDAHLLLVGMGITFFPDRPAPPPPAPPPPPSPPRERPPCPAIEGTSLPDVDGDGCREPDADADRVRDPLDRCPAVPEDRDGFEDDDGCPDPDNDRDGINDPDDRCPDVPEVVNGVDDHDGCPDEGGVVVREGRIVIEESVFFDSDSARIRERSRPVLAAVAAIIRDVPASRPVLVEGHADQRGTDQYNFTLSFMRALAVAREVAALGVRPAQLRPLGFGRRVPRTAGTSPAELAANRRVEIIVSGVGSVGDAQTVGGWVYLDDAGRSRRTAGPSP
ncbi:MAG: Flagellar motor rotation protein MotB [Myxococcaceae bacterium]|nr:Flagellar motor rotation protein MotB [Myxococcaceae bacterium]